MNTTHYPPSVATKTHAIHILVICSVILAQNLLTTELSPPFIVSLGLLIMAFSKVQHNYFRVVWPLFAVFILGIIGISDQELHDIFRDIAYALMPISLIFIGYWIANNNGISSRTLQIIVVLGVISAIIHLAIFALNPELLKTNIVEIRRALVGITFDNLVVLSLALGFFQYRLNIGNLFPWFLPRFIALSVLLMSFVLSYSRTAFVIGIILSFALWKKERINFRFVFNFTAVILLFYFFTFLAATSGDDLTFSSKLANSLTEIAVSDYQDYQDINDHWRGFETHQAWVSFLSGNVFQHVFGQGFGALADLGFYMTLNGENYRYISVFHNGYSYILLKTGLLGLLFYMLFYLSIIRYTLRYINSLASELRFLARLLLGCILCLMFTMLVVGGMAEMHDSEFIFLVGFLIRRIEIFKYSKCVIYK